MNDELKRKIMIGCLFGFFGLLILLCMFLSAWWGSYVSCTDGGGHLHYTVPGIEYQCLGFYIQDDPRLLARSAIPLTTNLSIPDVAWGNVTNGT